MDSCGSDFEGVPIRERFGSRDATSVEKGTSVVGEILSDMVLPFATDDGVSIEDAFVGHHEVAIIRRSEKRGVTEEPEKAPGRSTSGYQARSRFREAFHREDLPGVRWNRSSTSPMEI